MAPRGEKRRKGEEVSAECRALQGATTARPTRRRSFHVSARVNIPDVAKAREELEAQTSPKAREMEELVAQEEGETYNTRRKGPHVQEEDRERQSTTKAKASTRTKPDEFRIEEDTARDGCHNTRGTKTWKNPVRSSR